MNRQTTEELLQEFKRLYKETKGVIDAFPRKKRKEVLFDRWSLKDVVAHLNHWAEHDLACLKALKKDKEPFWAPDVDEYNNKGVQARKEKNWKDIYGEFNLLLGKVINEYETLPKDLWNRRFWKNREFTPLKFLKIDVDHYKNEHLPQLRKYIK